VPVSLKGLIAEANQAVPRIAPAEVKAMLDRGEAVVVDVREPNEVAATGRIPGSLNIPRGLIEFKADAEAATPERSLLEGKAVVLHCGGGSRAALAGKTLKDLGYEKVFNLGGFKDWVEAGLPIEPGTG
jgi:rhodanese-related sulfurtransferase